MIDTAKPAQHDRAVEPPLTPSLSGDIRHLIPQLGLRNYWYAAIAKKRVPTRQPFKGHLIGEDVVFFRGKDAVPVALDDVCPHRGARLSEGHVHWQGTVSCPYHGWTFDEQGENIAVLSEGPDSKVCGKEGTTAKKYPTTVLKGVVFVWIGDTEAAPIEENVPTEFFDPEAYIVFNDHIYWPTNWCVALENSMAAHVGYLHRDNTSALLSADVRPGRGSAGERPSFTGNGFAGGRFAVQTLPPREDIYPHGRWPKHHIRRLWSRFLGPIFNVLSPTDAEVVQWRRLIVTKQYGGQDAPFGDTALGEAEFEDLRAWRTERIPKPQTRA